MVQYSELSEPPMRLVAYSAAMLIPLRRTQFDSNPLRRAMRMIFVFYLLAHMEVAWQTHFADSALAMSEILKVTLFHSVGSLTMPYMLLESLMPLIPTFSDYIGVKLGQWIPVVVGLLVLLMLQPYLDNIVKEFINALIG